MSEKDVIEYLTDVIKRPVLYLPVDLGDVKTHCADGNHQHGADQPDAEDERGPACHFRMTDEGVDDINADAETDEQEEETQIDDIVDWFYGE